VGMQLSRELEETIYRVVQEGLTNALKHAPGAAVELAFGVEDGELAIRIRDDGGVGDSRLSSTGAGLGLTGMRERVAGCGGRLDAGPVADGGWRLSATLPLPT
jgi:signal transduction histidine kinase